MSRPILLASCLLLSGVILAVSLHAAPPVPLGRDAGLRQAEAMMDSGSTAAAIEILERLNQLEGGQCGICLLQLAEAHARRGENQLAAAAARRALGLLPEARERAWAHAFLSFSLFDPSGDREILAEAEANGRQALELAQDARLRRWSFETLGSVLWRQRHFDDLVDIARGFLAADPDAAGAELAQRALCAARLAGNVPGPDVEVRPPSPPVPVVAPRKRYHPEPRPVAAGSPSPAGRIVAEGIVDTEGCYTDLQIVDGIDPALDQAVLDTLARWTFQPASLAGQPVRARYRMSFEVATTP